MIDADPDRGSRLLRQGRRRRPSCAAKLRQRRLVPAQHLGRAIVGRPGGRGRRLPRHRRGDPAAHRRNRSARRCRGRAASGWSSGFGMINYDRGLCSGAAILAARMMGRSTHDARPTRHGRSARTRSCARACRRCRRRAQPRGARPHCGAARGALRAAGAARIAARCSIRRAKPAAPACRTGCDWKRRTAPAN